MEDIWSVRRISDIEDLTEKERILLAGKRNRKPAKSLPDADAFAQRWLSRHEPPHSEFSDSLHQRARELVELQRDPDEDSMSRSQLEFRLWLRSLHLQSIHYASSQAGFSDVDGLQKQVAESGVDAVVQQWAARCKLDESVASQLRHALNDLPAFHSSYPTIVELAEQKQVCMQFCNSLYTLGPVFKRNIARTGKWRQRIFTFFRGALAYGVSEYGTNEEKGWSLLHNAFVREADQSPQADREHCLELYVENPSKRVFLIAVDNPTQLRQWKRVVEMHRQFCGDWPELVDTVDVAK